MNEKYPRGKFSDDDEGALNVAITMKDKTLIIDFGKPVAWIGMSKDQAYLFARVIMEVTRGTE